MFLNQKMKKNWFTILEILIIIAVFSIWIMAVFYLVTNNLEKLDDIRTKNTATFLAKEWIELIFNSRDANLQKELKWNCVFTDKYINDPSIYWEEKFCDWFFSSWIDQKFIKINSDPREYPVLERTNSSGFYDNLLYLHTENIDWNNIFRYNHDSIWWEETIFSRYISFHKIKEWNNILPIDKIIKVRSSIIFKKWSKTWEVFLESFIGNY